MENDELPALDRADLHEFLKGLRDQSANVFSGDGRTAEAMFTGDSPFRIICTKCNAGNVSVISDGGGHGSDETGSWPGSLTLKCRTCGSAVSTDAA